MSAHAEPFVRIEEVVAVGSSWSDGLIDHPQAELPAVDTRTFAGSRVMP